MLAAEKDEWFLGVPGVLSELSADWLDGEPTFDQKLGGVDRLQRLQIESSLQSNTPNANGTPVRISPIAALV